MFYLYRIIRDIRKFVLNTKMQSYPNDCVYKWSEQSQIIKCNEELKELGIELDKYLLYGKNKDWKGKETDVVNKTCDEIADVLITIETMIYLFDPTGEKITERLKFKLNRLKERLNE